MLKKGNKQTLREYYFYGGGYKEISPRFVRDFKLDRNFKVGSICVGIYYSPQFQDESRKKNISEDLEKLIKDKRTVEDAIMNVSMLQNVKISCYAAWCKKILRLFIRTP